MSTINHWTSIGLIAIALLITVPLAGHALTHPTQRLTERRFVAVLLGAGALAVLALFIGPGIVAAVLTAPWLMLGIGALVADIRRTVHAPRDRFDPQLLLDGPLLAYGWLAAAAMWLTAHRLGIEPLGFDRVITLLTVGHFHHAGFGLTALLLLARRHRRTAALDIAIWLHQAGMLTVAAGITYNDHLEVIGGVMIVGALIAWTVTAGAIVRANPRTLGARLVAVAAIAWIIPMFLALGWALGPFLPDPIVTTFTTMLRFHAAIQVIGLIVCGLLGLALLTPQANPHTASRTHVQPTTTTATEADDAVAHPTDA